MAVTPSSQEGVCYASSRRVVGRALRRGAAATLGDEGAAATHQGWTWTSALITRVSGWSQRGNSVIISSKPA